LIDKVLAELERAVEVKDSAAEALRRIGSRFPLLAYLGAIAAITGILTSALVANANAAGVSWEVLTLVVMLSLLATGQLAVTMVNWLATLLVTPRAFANGFLHGYSTVGAYVGGGPLHAHQRSAIRRS
jgi:hypothetical protein